MYPITALVILERQLIAVTVFGPRFAQTGTYLLPIALAIEFSSVSRLGGTLLAGIGQPRGNFWPMAVAGAFTLVGVPVMLSWGGPQTAAYPYLIGWVAATAATIVFAVKDGLNLDYVDGFGRPAIPLAIMLAAYFAADLIKIPILVTLVGSLTLLALSTWVVEQRHLPHFKRPSKPLRSEGYSS